MLGENVNTRTTPFIRSGQLTFPAPDSPKTIAFKFIWSDRAPVLFPGRTRCPENMRCRVGIIAIRTAGLE